MNNKLIIISNDRFYDDKSNFYCDHVAEKTLPDGLSNKFSITVIGRSTNIKRFHKLETKNVEHHSNFISYLFSILKRKIKSDYKFLILSISPYTFFASLLFIFSKKKPIIYLRSDGHQEYKSILDHISNSKLPFKINKFFSIKDLNKIIFFMLKDKKNISNKINLVLLKKIGLPVMDKEYSKEKIKLFLKSKLIN